MQLDVSQNYQEILLHNSGLLDVRAPVEFQQGALPNAANLPLLDNNQRHQVGLRYKQAGKDQAIALGHTLIQGEIKQNRIAQWTEYTKQHNNSYLYCLRGGLRSHITQQWLHESGVRITRVHGGYKALRRFLLKELSLADQNFEFILVGGLTGCRKTTLIQNISNGIDLEGAAYHRGSSFGAHAKPQSTQINFENKIALDLLKARDKQQSTLVLEDEGKFIGSVDIPKNIYLKMRQSPIIVIEQNLSARLEQLYAEYIVGMLDEYSALHSDQETAFVNFAEYLSSSLLRIKKRLGTHDWQQLHQGLQYALAFQKNNGDPRLHFNWLKPLLVQYYDPMYKSQLENRSEHIVFRGDFESCYGFLKEATSASYA